ncbi:MAG: phosphoenolpyruvate--protein phosphotransferase, partial [Planctomycetes bacterium]|nr:phosphoenolpyruvate--protein phosphotransferase [Planctomycetota bacterium]
RSSARSRRPSPTDLRRRTGRSRSFFNRWVEVFRNLEDEFFRQRYVDLIDLRQRVLRHLRSGEERSPPTPSHPAVLIAEDLTPSETAELDRTSVLGFATEHGGSTSHTAIVAKSLGIPAICGLGPLGEAVPPGASLICDGEKGLLILDPDAATLAHYRSRQEQLRRRARVLRRMSSLPAETPDGWPVGVFGNIEFPFEVDQAVRNGADGIGLYRTEFLYAERQTLPDEEAHVQAYREALARLKGRTLTIRTFDFGADKFGDSVGYAGEPNPFLGCRSIRLCFARPELFTTQLRAILRASSEGRISLLFPMISSVTEFRSARALLERAKEDLRRNGIPFDANLKVGAMVEIPSAAIMADLLAREVDFFSLGSNDLTQYGLAVDRTNERVANLFRPSNPGILRLVRNVVREGTRSGVRVSLCGEMAAERPYTLLLLGMGIRHFSVAPNLVPEVKRVVRSVSRRDAAEIAQQALSFATSEEVDSYLAEEAERLLGDL